MSPVHSVGFGFGFGLFVFFSEFVHFIFVVVVFHKRLSSSQRHSSAVNYYFY